MTDKGYIVITVRFHCRLSNHFYAHAQENAAVSNIKLVTSTYRMHKISSHLEYYILIVFHTDFVLVCKNVLLMPFCPCNK